MFTCKDNAKKLNIAEIINPLQAEGRRTVNCDDPTETVWYLSECEQISICAHPHLGMVFYNSELHLVEIYDHSDDSQYQQIVNLLSDYGIDEAHAVWYEIGIDNVDYQKM